MCFAYGVNITLKKLRSLREPTRRREIACNLLSRCTATKLLSSRSLLYIYTPYYLAFRKNFLVEKFEHGFNTTTVRWLEAKVTNAWCIRVRKKNFTAFEHISLYLGKFIWLFNSSSVAICILLSIPSLCWASSREIVIIIIVELNASVTYKSRKWYRWLGV